MEFQLKPGLLLGAVSAQTGGQNGSWHDWYCRGYIKDGPSAADRWREDVALMRDMGVQCCRLSAEWSKIEPADGVFDESAIARCREELEALLDAGIRPLLTLWHFDNPLWLEKLGGFANRDDITAYLLYVRRMVESVGDLVSEYVTVNEPNVYAYNGYFAGIWPPGRKSFLEMSRVMTNLAAAHIEAYGLIRKTRLQMGFKDTKVGFANHLCAFAPKDPADPVHRFWTARTEQLFQDSLTRAMCLGRPAFPIGKHPAIVPGRYCDFHGVNYYTRATISGPAENAAEGCAVSDLGWEIYPEGIAEAARKVYELLPRPIYITENGVCDNADAFRARYIAEHLQAVCESGLPIERYYHRSFCDGWEWAEGYTARFGLVHVDFDTQARTVKRSGEFYRRVIQEGGVSRALYEAYCDTPYPAAQRKDGD